MPSDTRPPIGLKGRIYNQLIKINTEESWKIRDNDRPFVFIAVYLLKEKGKVRTLSTTSCLQSSPLELGENIIFVFSQKYFFCFFCKTLMIIQIYLFKKNIFLRNFRGTVSTKANLEWYLLSTTTFCFLTNI